MSWQEVMVAVLQFTFLLALWPTIRGPEKPAFYTSLWTAFALTAMGACFLSLGLLIAAVGTWTPAWGWWWLTWQTRPRRQPAVNRLRACGCHDVCLWADGPMPDICKGLPFGPEVRR